MRHTHVVGALGVVAMAAPPRISLAWQNINKHAKLRAIIFDARCILRAPEERDATKAKEHAKAVKQAGLGNYDLDLRDTKTILAKGTAGIKDMLRSEIREELVRRGLSSVGKPWEIQARLQEAMEAEQASPSSSPPPSPPPPPAPKIDTGIASSPMDKRAAYAAKLRARVGGSIAPDGSIVANDSSRPLAADERPVDNSALIGSMGWHLQPGARDLLTYCDMRNIYRALLPYEVDSDEAALAQAQQLSTALKVPPWHHVLTLEEAAATRRGETSALMRAITQLELGASSNLMLVSDQSAVLRSAKKGEAFSCFFRKALPGAPAKLPADFHADNLIGVQHAIEDLNGVTFRDADTEIRSKFGVYQT